MNIFFKVIKQCFIFILVNAIILLFHNPIICQTSEIKDCNGKDIPILSVLVSSSNNQTLNLSNCTFSQGKLSEYLNCIKNNNPSLPASAHLMVSLTSNPASGISGADLVLLKDEILQKIIISNTCNRVGSDSDSNNKLNTIDLCLIRKHILGISNITPAWKFYKSQNLSLTGIGVNSDLVFPVTDFPLSTLNILGIHNGNVNQVTTPNDTCVLLCQPSLRITPGQDEVRTLTPDYFLLNKSCVFPDLSLQILNASGQIIGNDITQNMAGSQFTVQLKLGNTSQVCTTKLSVFPCESLANMDVDQINTLDSAFVDLMVRNAEFISGYQFSMRFDTTHLQFVKVEKGNEVGFSVTNDIYHDGKGHVNISRFNETSNLGLEEGTRLFRLKFKRKSSLISNVIIDPENVETLLFDINKNEYCTDITYLNDTNPPVCLQDTIILQSDTSVGYATLKFTDFASDDFGTVLFDSGFDEFDMPLTNIDTFVCGTDLVAYILFKDANGLFKQCVFRIIVDCPIDSCSNKYLYFDGVNDRINIPNQHTGNVEFTIECWFKSENTTPIPGTGFNRLFTLGTSNRLEIGIDGNNIRLHRFSNTSLNFPATIQDNKWHHFALTRDDSTISIYIDGIPLTQSLVSGNIDLRSIRVGYFDNNNLNSVTLWKGGIDEIKLWNYELSQAEINYSKNRITTNKKDCGLIGYWRMEDGIANGDNQNITTIIDSIGNNNGTLVGFGLTGDISNFVCNDSITILPDSSICCEVAIFHSTQCNIINLNSAPLGFASENDLTYSWTSPNTNFTASTADTTWIYQGALNEVIICLEVTDGNCTAMTCDTIQVTQPEIPIFENCIESLVVPYISECGAILDLGNITATDQCSFETIISTCERSDGLEMADAYPIGSTSVTCMATSISGLTNTCSFIVEVVDQTPPLCSNVAADFYLDENGVDTLILSSIPLPGTDECSQVFYVLPNLLISTDCLPTAGTFVDIQDLSGNVSSCLVSFNVIDTLAPICVPLNVNIIIQDTDTTYVDLGDIDPIFTDNCSTVNIAISSGKTAFTCFDLSNQNEITITGTDESGNETSCVYNIILLDPEGFCDCVIDNTPPDCGTTSFDFYLDQNGVDTLQSSLILNFATDDCSSVKLSNNIQEFIASCNTGLVGAVISIEDNAGNITDCNIIYNVLDTLPIKCMVSDQIIMPVTGQDSVAVQYVYGVMDNCPNPTVTFSIPEGTIVPCGFESEVTMYVSDNFGNQDSCNFTFTVGDCMPILGIICGNVAEDFNCDGEITSDELPLTGIAVAILSPLDNDTLFITFTDSLGNFKIDSLPAFSFRVRPVRLDDYSVSFPVNDEYLVTIDTIETIENLNFGLSYSGPDIAIPLEKVCYQPGDTVHLNWMHNNCFQGSFAHITSSICGNNMHSIIVNNQPNDGSFDYIIPTSASNQVVEFGIITNTNQSFFNCIEINDLEIDFNFELIDCKEFQFVANSGYASYQWSFGDGFSDFTESTTTHAYTENQVYEVCLEIETNLGCKNQICKELIVEGECDDCNVTFESLDNGCLQVVFNSTVEQYELDVAYQWTVDNGCPNCPIIFSEAVDPFIIFDGPGSYEVCVIAIDGICSDTFCRPFVRDTTFATFENCPDQMVKLYVGSDCNAVTFDPQITIAAYCMRGSEENQPPIIYTRSDGLSINSPYQIGLTNVAASFTDYFGITSTCDFAVEVSDTISPVCNIRPLINIGLDLDGQVILEPAMVNNGSFDNCGEIVFTLDKSNFNCDDIGNNTVMVTISDGTNETTCATQVRIEDNLPPTCSLESMVVFVDENGNIPLELTDLIYTAQDNCGMPSIQLLGTNIPCNETGHDGTEHPISMIVTDASGLSSQCNATILLRDTIRPKCVELEVFFDVTQLGQIATPFIDPEVFIDNCKIIGLTYFVPEAICENLGSQVVEVKVNDSGGNQSLCPVTITYIDKIPPTCIIEDVEVSANQDGGALVSYGGTATDPCNDNITISYSIPDNSFFNCGDYPVTMTATDEHGNSSSCEFMVMVKDCDACCLSEQAFMDATSVDLDLESDLISPDNCMVKFISPKLSLCQIVTEISWGDGTVSRGSFTNAVDFSHRYTDPAIYEVCVTYEEENTLSCFENKICNTFEVLDNCTLKRSKATFDYNNIIIFPNPTTRSFNVSGGSIFTHYEMMDQLGRMVISKKSLEKENDISQLQNGLYFIRLHVGSIIVSKTIIKIQ